MKQLIYLLTGPVLLASCAAPKLTYQFDTHRYQTVSKENQATRAQFTAAVRPEEWVASTEPGPVVIPAAAGQPTADEELRSGAELQQKPLRAQHLAKKMRVNEAAANAVPQVKNDQTTELDEDLKMAAVFGTMGIVGLLLSGLGDFFLFIGGLALLAGAFFFIRWLIRQ